MNADHAKHSNKADSGVCIRGVEYFTFAWIAGLLLAFVSSDWAFRLPLLLGIWAGGLTGLCLMKLLHRKTLLLCTLAAILATGAWFGYERNILRPLEALDGQRLLCSGTVKQIRVLDNDRIRYTLSMRINGIPTTVDWYISDIAGIEIGDEVTLDAEFTRIESDYRYQSLSGSIGNGKILRIYDSTLCDHRPDTGFSLRRTLHDYRQSITQIIRETLPVEEAGLLLGMLFGEKQALSETVTTALFHTGIGHITSVSGLHLVFFCTLLGLILKRFHLPPKAMFAATFCSILIFSLMVDSSVAVYRSGLMLLLAAAAPLFGRYPDTLRSLCWAMLICTVFTPYVIVSASFWLSVSGVFGIGIAAPWITRHLPKRLRSFASLCCVSIAVFPASIVLCGESSLLSPIGNLILLPLSVGALYIGLLVVCTGGLTAFLLPIAGLLCRLTTELAVWMAKLPFAFLTISSAQMQAFVVLAAGCVLLVAWKTKRQAPTAVMAAVLTGMLAIGLFLESRQNASRLQIAVLGTETQSTVVLTADRHTWVIDLTDAAKNAEYVSQYLEDYGIRHIDGLTLSGGRAAAAYQELLQTVEVQEIWMPEDVVWRDDMQLFGQTPQKLTAEQTVSVGNALLTLDMERHRIQWQGYDVILLDHACEASVEALIVLRYGGEPAVSDTCGIWIVPAVDAAKLDAQSYAGSNYLLTVWPDGRIRVTDLES